MGRAAGRDEADWVGLRGTSGLCRNHRIPNSRPSHKTPITLTSPHPALLFPFTNRGGSTWGSVGRVTAPVLFLFTNRGGSTVQRRHTTLNRFSSAIRARERGEKRGRGRGMGRGCRGSGRSAWGEWFRLGPRANGTKPVRATRLHRDARGQRPPGRRGPVPRQVRRGLEDQRPSSRPAPDSGIRWDGAPAWGSAGFGRVRFEGDEVLE